MKVHLIISGQVQGVFFRRSAKTKADSLGISGWIRNNKDGSVETVGVGEKSKLEEFAKWCKKGTVFANVLNVEENWADKNDYFEEFSII